MEILNFPGDDGIIESGLRRTNDRSPTRLRLRKGPTGVGKGSRSLTSLESDDIVKGTKLCLLSPNSSKSDKQFDGSASFSFPDIIGYSNRQTTSLSKGSPSNPKVSIARWHSDNGETDLMAMTDLYIPFNSYRYNSTDNSYQKQISRSVWYFKSLLSNLIVKKAKYRSTDDTKAKKLIQ